MLVYSVFNTNNNIIYIDYRRNKLIKAETSQQTKKAERRFKESTKCYKFCCGVEHSRARVLKRSKSIFSNKVENSIEAIETIEGPIYIVVLAQI